MRSAAKSSGNGVGQEQLAQLLRIEPHRREIPREQIADPAGACGHDPAPYLGRIVGEAEHVVAQRPAGHAGGIGRAGDRADRGAGDRRRHEPELVERLEHGDVGEPAGAAGPEREGEALHRASQANAQAVAASGRTIAALAGACSLVAVPSRTRPTMPW